MPYTKEYMDLIQITPFFFDLRLEYFCSFIFKSTLEKYYIPWKNTWIYSAVKFRNSVKSANSDLKKKKLPKTSLKTVTTNVWVLSTSLVIVYFGHPEITNFNCLLRSGDYLSAAQFVLKMLALRGNLCLSDLSLSHIRL